MQVAFWSPNHGQTGTTTTAITYASMVAITNNYKVLLGHSQFGRSTLERCLVQQKSGVREDLLSFSDNGLDALRRLAKNGRLLPEMVCDYTTPLLAGNRLDLLQGIDGWARSEADEEIHLLRKIFTRASVAYDLVMIDVHSGMSKNLTQRLLEDADMVVVCLNQNRWLLEDYFKDKQAMKMLESKKVIYHISRYDKDSRYTLKNIKKMFKLTHVIATPYRPEIMDAFNSGLGLDFFMRHVSCQKRDKLYPLMKDIHSGMEIFLRVISENVGSEEVVAS